VNIPAGITALYPAVFCRTAISSITIPASVTSIGDWAFGESHNLTSITFLGTIPSSGVVGTAFATQGDLRDKFYETDAANGTPGTYTTSNPGWDAVWTKS
jgi:hypothetical protein